MDDRLARVGFAWWTSWDLSGGGVFGKVTSKWGGCLSDVFCCCDKIP